MGDVGIVAVYPNYDTSFQLILAPQDADSPHLEGPTMSLMHFQEVLLLTNIVDKHMLY